MASRRSPYEAQRTSRGGARIGGEPGLRHTLARGTLKRKGVFGTMTKFTPAPAGGTAGDGSFGPVSEPTLAWAPPSLHSPAAHRQSGATPAAAAPFEPAVRVGRYSLLRELGRGGMGVTYVAYDEELDRRVAIKLVLSDLVAETAQRRLQREARVLARLVHPNIVTVHDVGQHGSQTFIAMEYVPGEPLSAWLAGRSRPWREVLGVFRQAGEGLRAAHAAGVVHRDVKPQNFIVGDDGRVRVLDFGLACLGGPVAGRATPLATRRPGAGRATPLATRRPGAAGPVGGRLADGGRAPGPAEGRLTDAGQAPGTVEYMAPEQLRGEAADARSDQFSLCVGLFEALHGRPAFASSTPFLRLASMYRGVAAEAPPGSQVPAWLHAAVVRGLAYHPGARWPSIDALLVALTPAPARPRARALLVAGATLALAGGGAAGARFAPARGEAAVCTGAQAQIGEAWNPAQREAAERAILATGAWYAAETWQHTAALLDRYADDWVAAYTDACETATVRGEQSQAALDRRMGCLTQRRRSLHALVHELSRIDAASIAGSTEAAANLPPIAACADPEVGRDRPPRPSDQGAAAQFEALEADLDRTEWLLELGKYDEGRQLARDLVESAEGLGAASMQGRTRVQLGRLELALGAHEAAEEDLKLGHMLARVAGEHDVALQAATQLVHLEGQLMARPKDAEDWERHVRAELPWVESETLRANSFNTLGALALVQRRYDQAFELCDRARALWQQALGPEHPEGTKALTNLGLVHYARGEYERAAEHHRHVLQVREKTLGGEHPNVAVALDNLGGARYRQGEYAEAAEHFARALAISERAWGAAHPYAADPPLIGMALAYVDGGRAAEAVAPAERALAILEGHHADAAGLAEARFALARALASVGRDLPRALALARQAHDAMRASSGALGLIAPGDVERWRRARERGRGPQTAGAGGPAR